MEKIDKTSCEINRPGEFIITEKALDICSFPANATIIDIGCGSGATVNYIRQHYGFNVFGIDNSKEIPGIKNNIISASAEKIPFDSGSVDGILMECSFSLMENQHKVLDECNRVLKEKGCLIISDMYSRGEPAKLSGSLGRIDTKETICSIIENCGFRIELFEDFTQCLQAMWGQMIFEKGADDFYSELGVCANILKSIKCGYFLIVAKIKESSV